MLTCILNCELQLKNFNIYILYVEMAVIATEGFEYIFLIVEKS